MTEQQIIETLAVKVMGWEVFHREVTFVGIKKPVSLQKIVNPETKEPIEGWDPLQNIADAWMIVEKIKDTDIGDDFDSIMDHFCLTQITPEQISRTVYSLTQR